MLFWDEEQARSLSSRVLKPFKLLEIVNTSVKAMPPDRYKETGYIHQVIL